MKVIEFDIRTIAGNLKRNARTALLLFLICVLVGAAFGFYQYRTYREKPRMSFAGEEDLSISDIAQDEEYYFNAFDRIQREATCLDLYYRYFQNVNLSKANRDSLSEAKTDYNAFYENYMEASSYYWNTPLSAVDKAGTISFYELKTEQLKDIKDSAERELAEDENLNANEKGQYENQKEQAEDTIRKLEELIDRLSAATDEDIAANNKRADKMLNENIENINSNIKLFNKLMQQIAESENYYILDNDYIFTNQSSSFGLLKQMDDLYFLNNRLNKAIIYAKSVEGLDSGKERMFAIITFFMLFGLVVSVTYGAFHTPKESRKEKKG